MKIIKLLPGGTVEKPVALIYRPKDAEKIYYNIKHGSKDKGFNQYTMSLDHAVFKGISDIKKNGIILDGDDYILKPVYNKKGEINKLYNGDTRYVISVDEYTTDKDATIVLWNIPNFYYTDVEYTIVSGNGRCIGSGTNGKNRDGELFTSPAPVLEIEGDVVIKWSGKDINNNYIGEILKRTNDVWTSEKITNEE